MLFEGSLLNLIFSTRINAFRLQHIRLSFSQESVLSVDMASPECYQANGSQRYSHNRVAKIWSLKQLA